MFAVLQALARPVLAMWALLLLARVGMLIWLADRVQAQHAWGVIFWEGLRFDGVLLGLIWFLPAAIFPLAALHVRSWRWAYQLIRGYATVWFVFLFFMAWSTPQFLREYDSLPNYLFVEYLQHMREVGTMLLVQYPLQIFLTTLVMPVVTVGYWRWTRLSVKPVALKWPWALLSALLLFALCAVLGRGTLQRRPANPALVAVTQDNLVNQLALSSGYNLLYSIKQSLQSEAGTVSYGKVPVEQMIKTVRAEMGLPDSVFNNSQQPTWHQQVATRQSAQPLNLVIVLEESLGAEFVGRLGGAALTPHLDALSHEGIWLDQLYATGTRSVRGIEAVSAGFPPTAAPSTVKLAKSQKDFFTLAQFLKDQGYQSTFYYGGESHFDNMRSFFMGNGFDRVVDKKDYPPSAFMATWGASDGDLFAKAHESFLQQTQPFFGLIFTSSNHIPFEFPDGEIAIDGPKATVENAVRYADHALGRFIAQAKKAPYWQNTVFLVVADHNSRVYGDALVPIHRFHIPGLILGGSVRPETIHTQASQIDLGPTLISLLGLTGSHPMIGRDLTQPQHRQGPGRAIMQFDKTQAYMEGERVVVLRPDLPPAVMHYDVTVSELKPSDVPAPDLVEKALAHAQFASMAYRDGWHRYTRQR